MNDFINAEVPATGAAAPSAALIQRFEDPSYAVPKNTPAAADRSPIDWSSDIKPWPTRNQFWRGTCVAFAAASCAEHALAVAGRDHHAMSPEFLYWNMRMNPDYQLSASDVPGHALGATKLRQAGQVLNDLGICREAFARYQAITLESELPNESAFADADKQRFEISESIDDFKGKFREFGRLAYHELSNGRTVAIATAMFQLGNAGYGNFTNPTTLSNGRVRSPLNDLELFLPPFDEQSDSTHPRLEYVGSHAFCLTGFQPSNDPLTAGWFIFRNSWGPRFGQHPHWVGEDMPPLPAEGYGAIPFSYVDNYAHELLSIYVAS